MPSFTRCFWLGIVPGLIVAAIFLLDDSRSNFGPSFANSQGKKIPPARPRDPEEANRNPLIGTFSCSARGCHGALDSRGDLLDPGKCGQNEYTQWTHDRHADAYRVLFEKRSKDMVRLLGEKTPAHETPRCLACHVNPLIAELPTGDPLAEQEKLFGVGCESCHGSANKWLGPHTSKNWHTLPLDKRRDLGMIPVADISERATACAGCHVGAPPLRDVNHDLIAAGHPRLAFEFGAFQANMPTHWRDPQKRKPSAKPIPEGRLWAIGQLASAEAALNLLIARADSKTGAAWPEFTEYDCYACHQSLAEPSARQQANPRGRKPGALPWGSWYFALTRPLAEPLPALDVLERKMQAPSPSRSDVQTAAKAALAELMNRRAELDINHRGEDLARQRILERYRTNDLVDPSWDGAEQLYLALHALQPSERLNALMDERAFPSPFDSPLSFSHGDAKPFQPRTFLEKLKKDLPN